MISRFLFSSIQAISMILVTKSSGSTEPFNREKILRTCMRAGASKQTAEKISSEIEKKIYNGISTREILKLVLSLLKKENTAAASRYDLSGALLRLGPAGFGFETFFLTIDFFFLSSAIFVFVAHFVVFVKIAQADLEICDSGRPCSYAVLGV